MDFKGVFICWVVFESLFGGYYSIFSDVWFVNILVDEIFNYVVWLYFDISDVDINDMVIYVILCLVIYYFM